jgi:hypothetical protein
MHKLNPNRRGAIYAVAALAAGIAGASFAQSVPATRQSAFARAMADYERQHFAAAYQAFWLLADQGHAEAARIALLMAAHGPRLYGQRFAIGEVQRDRWLAAALPHGAGTVTAFAR